MRVDAAELYEKAELLSPRLVLVRAAPEGGEGAPSLVLVHSIFGNELGFERLHSLGFGDREVLAVLGLAPASAQTSTRWSKMQAADTRDSRRRRSRRLAASHTAVVDTRRA